MVIKNCKIGNFVQVNGDVYNGCSIVNNPRTDKAKPEAEDVDFEEVDDLFDDFEFDNAMRMIESGNRRVADSDRGDVSHRGRHKSNKVVMAKDHSKQEQVIAKLKSLMVGKSGKDAAFVFKSFIVAGHILPATYTQFVNTFGSGVLCKSDFYDFLGRGSKVFDDDQLRAFACNIKF